MAQHLDGHQDKKDDNPKDINNKGNLSQINEEMNGDHEKMNES